MIYLNIGFSGSYAVEWLVTLFEWHHTVKYSRKNNSKIEP